MFRLSSSLSWTLGGMRTDVVMETSSLMCMGLLFSSVNERRMKFGIQGEYPIPLTNDRSLCIDSYLDYIITTMTRLHFYPICLAY